MCVCFPDSRQSGKEHQGMITPSKESDINRPDLGKWLALVVAQDDLIVSILVYYVMAINVVVLVALNSVAIIANDTAVIITIIANIMCIIYYHSFTIAYAEVRISIILYLYCNMLCYTLIYLDSNVLCYNMLCYSMLYFTILYLYSTTLHFIL